MSLRLILLNDHALAGLDATILQMSDKQVQCHRCIMQVSCAHRLFQEEADEDGGAEDKGLGCKVAQMCCQGA